MSFLDLEPDTLRTVIDCQLKDLNELKQHVKGKHRHGEAPDHEVALDVYEAELTAQARLLADQAMCRSIAQAVGSDAAVIGAAAHEEKVAHQDREIAVKLSNQDDNAAFPSTPKTARQSADDSEKLADEFLDKLSALYMPPADHDHQNDKMDWAPDGAPMDNDVRMLPESSSWAASRPTPNVFSQQGPTQVCISCLDKFPLVLMALGSCSHAYCRECLEALFRASLKDQSLFPPRCCRQIIIPFDGFISRTLLPAALITDMQAKQVEYDTPDRTYCHDPQCSAFVPPQFVVGDIATCEVCARRTCAICKGKAHFGACPQDAASQEVIQIAKDAGWQRCFSCRTYVELHTGCNHISCRCGAHFCYVCALEWKTCQCQVWDEARLLERAEVIVDRNAGQNNAAPVNNVRRAAMVQQEFQNLVANHECQHLGWYKHWGRYRCEECNDRLPAFIYECHHCRILACRRCRFNRL